MDTMTVTDVDVNRDDTPDVLQQPQSGLAPQGFAAPVQHGTPVNRGTMTGTGVDLNRDGIPDVRAATAVWHCTQGVCSSCPIWSSSEHEKASIWILLLSPSSLINRVRATSPWKSAKT